MLWTTHLPCRRRLRGMWCSVAGTTNRMLVATVAALASTRSESVDSVLRSRRVLGCGVVLSFQTSFKGCEPEIFQCFKGWP